MPDRLSRREFLFYGTAAVSGITLGELGRRWLARADAQADAWRGRGLETWRTSVCRECPAACGMRVRRIDEVPVKVEGNPLCPIARGRLCARGQAVVASYFDPDRIVGPARRAGRRGEGRWSPITWDAALDELAAHIREAQAAPGGGGIDAFAAEERGPIAAAWTRFWEVAGGRVSWTPAATAARLAPGLARLTGAAGDPVFDLENATYVLSFGAPIVENWLSPVWCQRSFGRFRRTPGRPRGRLVQIEARRSLTARKADEWLALGPEEQLLLAYGLASVVLREARAAQAFLAEVGGTLDAFERAVAARITPQAVAELTGVPVVTVLRLARELAASPRPLVVVAAEASPALVDAVFGLNALVGALDREGGVLLSAAAPTPEPARDAVATLRDLKDRRPGPRIVAFRDASVLRQLNTPADVGTLLESARLVVSFSPYLDEAAAVSDLLLPIHTPLESWQAVQPAPVLGVETIAITAPAVSPRLETRDLAAVLAGVAQRVGPPMASACRWTSSQDLVEAELDRLAALRRGAPYGSPFDNEWLRQLERGGWWAPAAESPQEFREAVLQAGGWLDPFFAPGAIRQALAARGGLRFPEPPLLVAGRAPGGSGASEHGSVPLRLVPFMPAVLDGSGNPNQPLLFELLGQPDALPWRVWAELSPETAQRLGVGSGSIIRITSAAASIEAVAVLVVGMPAETVAVAFVPSVPAGGRWARQLAADARALWGDGSSAACTVRIAKV